jgi:hypothetical protein
MTASRRRLLWIASLAALAVSGCGSDGARGTGARHQPRRSALLGAHNGIVTIPDPAPTGIAPSSSAVAVIRGWANSLRHGDVAAAAHYFAIPSEMINGVGAGGQVQVLRIRTGAQAVAAQQTLPCGARLISADQRGRYVNALFVLTGRPGPGGSNCGGGVGTTARTNFVIAQGRIVEWIRAPSEPGDGGGAQSVPTPTVPTPGPNPVA